MRVMVHAITAVLVCACVSASMSATRKHTATPDFTQRAHAAFKGKTGAAIVMNAADGKVIAVVNPTISAQRHPPGSIFKLVTAFAALQESIVTQDTVSTCNGQLKLSGRTLHCTLPNGHGTVHLPEVIAQSCNITFYRLGLRLGSKRIQTYARAFGLSYKPTAKVTNPVNIARLATGQADGFSITLLEAAEMVRRIITNDITLPGAAPNQVHRNLAIIRKSMRLAVVKGTCANAALKTINVAGKTGSPEAADDPAMRNAWFVGYAPYEKPEVIVVVFVTRGHGYDSAAPIAKRIFSAYFGAK